MPSLVAPGHLGRPVSPIFHSFTVYVKGASPFGYFRVTDHFFCKRTRKFDSRETLTGLNLDLLKMDIYKMDMEKDPLFEGRVRRGQAAAEREARDDCCQER